MRGEVLINKNQIIDYVCKYLEDNKFTDIECRNTNKNGYDIVVYDEVGMKLIIETKGAVSEELSEIQVRTRISKALYTGLSTVF